MPPSNKLPLKNLFSLNRRPTPPENNLEVTKDSVKSHESKFDEIDFFSFGILKPDCIQRELVHEAFRRISSAGCEIVISKTMTLTETDILHVYSRCVEQPFFDEMKQFLTSSNCIVYVIKGVSNNAIEDLNNVVGSTDPKEAKAGTLRELGKTLTYNLAHSSNNLENFIKESGHFFSERELLKVGLNINYDKYNLAYATKDILRTSKHRMLHSENKKP